MVRHHRFFGRHLLLASLEFKALIYVKSVIPIDRLLRHEAEISFPSHHSVAVLYDVSSFLGCEVFLSSQKVVSEEEVKRKVRPQVLQSLIRVICSRLSLLTLVVLIQDLEDGGSLF